MTCWSHADPENHIRWPDAVSAVSWSCPALVGQSRSSFVSSLSGMAEADTQALQHEVRIAFDTTPPPQQQVGRKKKTPRTDQGLLPVEWPRSSLTADRPYPDGLSLPGTVLIWVVTAGSMLIMCSCVCVGP